MPKILFLGIDGGGSRCRARICDESGVSLAQAEGGPANIHADLAGALASIVATAQAAADEIGAELASLHAGLGLAGATGPEACARVDAAQLPFASIQVDSDSYAACLGAHAGSDGGIVIAGTGSAGLALVRGKRMTIGGHGFMLGDQGSGAVIGREALRGALLAHEGLAPASGLTRAIMMQFDNAPGKAIEWSRTAQSRAYGALAPQVFAAAHQGDVLALSIITEAAAALAGLGRHLLRAGAPRLCLIGGICDAIAPFLPADFAQALQPVHADAVAGAILMAKQRLPA